MYTHMHGRLLSSSFSPDFETELSVRLTARNLRVYYSLELLPCYACCGRSHCLTVSNSVSGYTTVRWHLVLCYHVFRSTQTPRTCQRSIRGRAHTVVNLADALGR